MLVMAQNNLLIMLENTDAWFVMLDKPPQDLNEDLLNTEDFPWDEAHEMIDSGAAKEQLRYLLEGGMPPCCMDRPVGVGSWAV
jgi:hypothetical protein